MKNYLLIILIINLLVIVFGYSVNSPPDYDVPYPDGFRKWTHVKTGVVGPQNPFFQTAGGFHHIYANAKAMEGYETGKFPEGSIFAFDVIEAIEKNSNTLEGKRRHVDVMIKDSIKFKETGGWGFEEYKDDGKTKVLTLQVRTGCFNCHAKQNDMIFSEWRN
jgi:hypothetical protein